LGQQRNERRRHTRRRSGSSSGVRPHRRFGRGQTFTEEGREIAEAKRAGLIQPYMDGQRWAQMIEEDREARRRGEHKARYYR
jgi:hypothetical protein